MARKAFIDDTMDLVGDVGYVLEDASMMSDDLISDMIEINSDLDREMTINDLGVYGMKIMDMLVETEDSIEKAHRVVARNEMVKTALVVMKDFIRKYHKEFAEINYDEYKRVYLENKRERESKGEF